MEIRDQLGRLLQLNKTPGRIVSLVPSQTELLVDLGLEANIVGITSFCIHPEYLKNIKLTVGGTKKVNLRKIKDLNPDIILCNKEENTEEMVRDLEKIAPVHISDVTTLEDAENLIRDYGRIFNREELAGTFIKSLEKKVDSLKKTVRQKPKLRVVYFIWKKPYMVAGRNTFINSMLELNGYENVIEDNRYPVIQLEELGKRQIDLCMLSTEPYSFDETDLVSFKPYANKVKIVNGEYFSWYGSRLLEAMDYFKNLG